MPGIFISYRRDSTAAFAGRLFDRLSSEFGKERTFMDVDGIEPGDDFVVVLDKRLRDAVAMLELIGPDWLEAKDDVARRRLDNPADFVRLEVATAVRREVRVIPVLMDGASMPAEQELPADLVLLSRRQAVVISHARFHQDILRLIAVLDKQFAEKGGNAKERPEDVARRRLQAEQAAEQARLRAERERIDQLEQFKRDAERLTWESRQKSGAGQAQRQPESRGKTTGKAIAFFAFGLVMLCFAFGSFDPTNGVPFTILFLISIALFWAALRRWKGRSPVDPARFRPAQSRGKRIFVAVVYALVGFLTLCSAFSASEGTGESAVIVGILFLIGVALFWAAFKKLKSR